MASFRIAAIEPVTPIALGQHGLAAGGVADQDPVEPGPEVGRRVGQAEDGHDLAGGRDVEARLARDALRAAAQADHDVPQRPVVHVEGALPENAGRVEVDIAEMKPVVDRGGEQVVRRGDRVEVAGELEVDRVRRLDPAGAAAGGAPLAAEDRPHRRLPQRQRRGLADPAQALRQADRRGRLPLAGRRRRDRRDQDQLARRPRRPRPPCRASSRTFALSRPYGSRCSAAIFRSRGQLGDRSE